jgi:lysyl-tRNA synthetase class 2
MEEKLTDQEQARREKLPKYVELGVDPFGSRYEWKASIRDIRKRVEGKTAEDLENEKIHVNVAGRLLAIRRMGKASFVNLKDEYGSIQAWIGINVVGEHDYEVFRLADLGDVVGLEGTLMFSRTGELTIHVEKYTHITKCLKPLPEKFHGLTDLEDRCRKRYLDLIVNDESRRTALLRPAIVKAIRDYCDSLGFIEVETPVLSPIAGGAAARPFITHHNTLDKDFYLRIATEHLNRYFSTKDPFALRTSLQYYGIDLVFACSVLVGYWMTQAFGTKAVWCVLVIPAALLVLRLYEIRGEKYAAE